MVISKVKTSIAFLYLIIPRAVFFKIRVDLGVRKIPVSYKLTKIVF
jgi:hypothetical protein